MQQTERFSATAPFKTQTLCTQNPSHTETLLAYCLNMCMDVVSDFEHLL